MPTRIQLLTQAAREAGQAILSTIPSQGIIEKEGRANIVTAADLASEKRIMELIKTHFPDEAILSEETESDLGNVLELEKLWVIDPIDGTSNFRYQRGYSCVSIAYVEKGQTKAGAVYDPFRDELYTAEKGMGAFLNNMQIKVGQETDISKVTVATDNSYNPEGTMRNLKLALSIQPMPWVLMRGSAVLTMCDVAAARLDLYFQTAVRPWDNAAAFLIVKEAGGVVTGLAGEEISFLSPEVVMGNQTLVDQCVRAFGLK